MVRHRRLMSGMVALIVSLIAAGRTASPVAAQGGGQDRPDIPDELIYATDRFLIHYTFTGDIAVDDTDSDFSGTPDYIEEVAAALEFTWDVEIGQMGWAAPPHDQGEGGDDRFDVYIQNLMPNGIAGYAQSENGHIGDNPETPERERRAAYSYIALDNDYQEAEGSGVVPLNLMKSTVAHEFNHVIQAGYDDFDSQIWIYEATATWMEMQVYPDITDSISYLPDLLDNPDICRTAEQNWYAQWLFMEFLTEKYGRDIVRTIWDETRQSDGYAAIDQALEPYGSTHIQESREFSAANLLRSYENGRFFPTVAIEGGVDQGTYAPDDGVQSFGADYVDLFGSGPVTVAFNGGSDLIGLLIGIRGGDAEVFDLSSPVTLDLNQYDRTFVVVHNDDESIDEDSCSYSDYNIDVQPSTDSSSTSIGSVSAANFADPGGGSGGSVTGSSGGVANAGGSSYHPPFSGGNQGEVSSSPGDLEINFVTLVPVREPVGYNFDYAYTMTAAEFGGNADYYVPNGDISANFDYVGVNENWLSITESPSPYDTIEEWLDAVDYDPAGAIRDVDGVEVLVEDLSGGGAISISATLILNGLFIVIDGDHSEDDVIAMVESVIDATQPPEVQGGTQFPGPDLGQPAPTLVPDASFPGAPEGMMTYAALGLCGLGGCLMLLGAVLAAWYMFRRKNRG